MTERPGGVQPKGDLQAPAPSPEAQRDRPLPLTPEEERISRNALDKPYTASAHLAALPRIYATLDAARERIAELEQERDEARATKDMHKERQQQEIAKADAFALRCEQLTAERDEALAAMSADKADVVLAAAALRTERDALAREVRAWRKLDDGQKKCEWCGGYLQEHLDAEAEHLRAALTRAEAEGARLREALRVISNHKAMIAVPEDWPTTIQMLQQYATDALTASPLSEAAARVLAAAKALAAGMPYTMGAPGHGEHNALRDAVDALERAERGT